MKQFYMTFGVQYPRELHPHWTGADSAGWVRITAESEDLARSIARQFFGDAWSRVYADWDFDTSADRRFYSRGEILHIEQLDQSGVEPLGAVVGSDAGIFTAPDDGTTSRFSRFGGSVHRELWSTPDGGSSESGNDEKPTENRTLQDEN